jgi:hypothetical protein
VKAAGTNPLTGEPAFFKTLPGSSEDHVKWMADTQHLSSNSVPGFDAVPGRELRCSIPAAGATTIIEHGGTPQLATPRQLNCGMALFTLLDGGLPPADTGLVALTVIRIAAWKPGL